MRRFKQIAPLCCIILCVPVYIYYYLGHPFQIKRVWFSVVREFSSASLGDWGVLVGHVWVLLVAWLVMLSGYGFGRLVWSFFERVTKKESLADEGQGGPFVFVMVFGLGVIGFLAALPGFTGIFNKWSLGSILLTGVLCAIFILVKSFKARQPRLKKTRQPLIILMWSGLGLLVLWILLPGLLSAFSPPLK